MTVLVDARESICQRWKTLWSGTATWALDNEVFRPVRGTAWARLSANQDESDQRTLGGVGSRRFQRNGIVLVQLFVPKNTGMRAVDLLVGQVKTVFEGASFDGIWTFESTGREVGDMAYGGINWYEFDVKTPYAFHETR